MSQVPAENFNYASLSSEIAKDACETALSFQKFRSRTAVETARLGTAFTQLKSRMPHGLWQLWIRDACQTSERMVQNFMSLAAAFGDKPEAISYLNSTTAIALSAKKTPSSAREAVIRAHEEGRPLDERAVRKLIAVNRAPTSSHKTATEHATMAPVTEEQIKDGLRLLNKASREAILKFLSTLETVPVERYRAYLSDAIERSSSRPSCS